MKDYKNFQIAAYVYAYYLETADEQKIQRDIEYFTQFVPLKKVYLENHRGMTDIPIEKLELAKRVFERNGIQTSGGITSTGLVGGERKPSLFDTFCYSDAAHRKEYCHIVAELSQVFDEIILDDYFFLSCRCEKCIEGKGTRSWSEYRLGVMEEFSMEIVTLAKSINPKLNFIIKYPNWYESYHETGYNPGKQKDIFDMVYTGTESREPYCSSQHIQRYLSYSLYRWLENVAPGRNGGGWIDSAGSDDNLNRWLEQANLTLFSKAKELTLFNFEWMLDDVHLPILGQQLYKIDALMGQAGNPIGVSAYDPFEGKGESQLLTYLGMGGIPFEPTPYFNQEAATVFLAENAAGDPDIMDKLRAYVKDGGNAVVTAGFLRKTADRGIYDMTSVRPTHRHIQGRTFFLDECQQDYCDMRIVEGTCDIAYEALDYKTNATWADILLVSGEHNYPILTEDYYGKGRLFILNIPENFSQLYKLPAEVWQAIARHLTRGLPLYAAGTPRFSLFAYDNAMYGIYNFRNDHARIKVIVRGGCSGLEDIASGERYSECIALKGAAKKMDSCTCIEEEQEYQFEIPVIPGQMKFFRVLP